MALIKCSECAKYVSDKNSVCSHCKKPIAKSHFMESQSSKWESVGLFMAATGGLTFLFAEPPNITGIIMAVSGLIVYGAGKFLIGKYI